MLLELDTDIAIVGNGPVGQTLAAAHELPGVEA
jgi:2-polyprenyl-6-methoxyphenol hydroxylase-like FAD-dependent oxidoreductase